MSKGCPVTVTGRSSSGFAFGEREERLVAVGEGVVDERKSRREVELDRRAVGVELVLPEPIFLRAEDVAGLQIGQVDPARVAQQPGFARLTAPPRRPCHCAVKPFLLRIAMPPMPAAGERLRDVDLRDRQRPRAALDFGRTGEGGERRFAVGHREPVHRTVERHQARG